MVTLTDDNKGRGMEISEELQYAAESIGIKLEMVGGIPVWEALPVFEHQQTIFRIQNSIHRSSGTSIDGGCGCVQVADVDIRFPDGSQKRPDISIFCRVPDERRTSVKLLPEAVIEIISQGYEAKDMLISIPFYVAQGVKDVIVFDPYTNRVTHVRGSERTEDESPIEINLLCGCTCII